MALTETEALVLRTYNLAEADKIVVCLHVRVRLKDQTEWIDGRFADVFTFRDGKAIHYRSFAETQEALEWAGAEDSETN